MLHPLMLLGLAGLAVPVILHLIQRQRLKPQVLATLQFLDPQDAANAFAPVPRDLLQLLLRLALLAVFVLLMARLLAGGAEVGPRTMAVILDQSLSTQQTVEGNQSLFERNKAHVLDLIDGLRPEDRMALALVGDQVTVETGFLRDKDELRRVAEACTVSDGGGLGLVPAVRRAVGQLAARREVNACVLVFSDHQRDDYRPYVEEAQKAATDALRDQLAAGRVRLILVDERPPGGANLSVESARASPERVHVGASSRITAVVRNNSAESRTTQVRLVEGETSGTPRSLTLEAGEAAHIDLVHRSEAAADSALRVEIDEDPLPGDNRFHLPVRVRDRRQILLVAPPAGPGGDERTLELSHRPADLLAYALNPGEALGKGGGTYISVKRVTPQAVARVSLPIYSVVILFGVTDLPEQTVKDLAAFVKNGGGLWLVPEGDLSPTRFNDSLAPLLGGFLIGQQKTADPVQTVARDEVGVQSPLLLPLLREEWGNPREIHFGRYFGVQSPGVAKVALRAGNGDPLALVLPLGRGKVFLQLYGAGLEAGSLPRTTAFVPVVQQIAAYLGGRGEDGPPDVMRVGDVRRLAVPEFRGLSGDVALAGPAPHQFPLTGADAEEVRVEGVLKAGSYEVTHPGKRTSRQRWLAVNPVLGQSRLESLGEEDQAALFGTRNVERLPYAEVAGQFTRNHEVLWPVLALVLVAFTAEALTGAWLSRKTTSPLSPVLRGEGSGVRELERPRPLTPGLSSPSTGERGDGREALA